MDKVKIKVLSGGHMPVELVQVDELTPTERGNGGFGSTGKR